MTQTTNPSRWRVGTVTQIRPEALGLRSYTFAFDAPVKHDVGQHYEIRLTAEDGYQAARLYSAAMPANGTSNMLQLTIALMPHGEVSSYLFNNVKPGDKLEIRGPLGRYFIWTPDVDRPTLLIGGGSGVVPLRAIRLQHQHADSDLPMKLLYSVKTYHDMAYKYELFPPNMLPPKNVIMTFTSTPPPGWKGYMRRVDPAMLGEVLEGLGTNPLVFVCGPTQMAESVADSLQQAGVKPESIRTERFGETS
jgi:ferredoxin-NADP reductase